MTSRGDLSPLIAHRGWSELFPENSLPAFAAAIAAKADEVEFDIVPAADDIAVVLHDPTLDRTTTLSGPVAEVDSQTLAAADVRLPDGRIAPGLGIPTLADVLDLLEGRVRLNVHAKAITSSGAELVLLQEYQELWPESVYLAGGIDVLRRVRAEAPALPLCLIHLPWDDIAELLGFAAEHEVGRIQLFTGHFEARHVAAAREQGLVVNQFYADTVPDLEAAMRLGVDAVLTNRIGSLRSELLGRGDSAG